MYKKFALILGLAMASMACMGTASPIVPYDTETPIATVATVATRTAEPQMPAFVATVEIVQVCAVVVRADALHLRNGPAETAEVLTWLDSGEVVRVLDRALGDWWQVEARGLVGFARSIYLQEQECV